MQTSGGTRRLRVAGVFLFFVGLVLATGPMQHARAASDVRLNQMQVIASHNSYHVEQPWSVLQQYIAFDPDAILLAYSHPPLNEQFDNEKVRAIELDIWADPTGNLWRPTGTPGFKTFHIEVLDMDSTCETFVECLTVVKAWSDVHPTHMPIMIQLEVKDEPSFPGLSNPVHVDSAQFDAMDAEIRSVFPADRLITPDDVRGSHSTLEEAVLTDGWPKIDDVRGRVMFTLDNKRDDYRQFHPSLETRIAFTPSSPGQPDAAFLKMNDPLGANEAEIRQRVLDGYVVRTRADLPVETAQSGDTTQREAALRSGAQWVSTDYPVPGLSTRWGTDYFAQIPGGTPARCNPVNAPAGCTNDDIENLNPAPVTTTTSTTTSAPTSSGSPTTAAPGAAAASPVVAVPRFTG